MTKASCAAIDLGASNGRVVVAETDGQRITLREACRFETPLVRDPCGYQCWDVDLIEERVREGLRAAQGLAPIQSVGVDTWGVDYVLLDGALQRVAPAVAYRDVRTQGAMERLFERMPAAEVYRRTGIQFQAFNSLYQLAVTAEHHPDWLARARRLLMLPDYFHLQLCGEAANEYTEVTTSQLWNVGADDWDDGLLELAGVSRALLSRPVEPGTVLGDADLPAADGRRVKVIAPATHDTASSVAAIPLQGPDDAFLSSGTWSLMGVESPVALAGDDGFRLNFTNEGGVGRRFRVLKNIVGLWIVQRLKQELPGVDHAGLAAAAAAAAPWRSLIDPEDPRFYNPPSMVAAVRGFCAETGQPVPEDAGALARCAFDGLALTYARVAEELGALRGRPLRAIQIVGGGAQNRLLDQLCADACQLPVRAGPTETSALGNACVQLMALGVLPSLEEARALVRRSFEVEEFTPGPPVPGEVARRFRSFAARRLEQRAAAGRAGKAEVVA